MMGTTLFLHDFTTYIMKNTMTTSFSQQILSGKLLVVIIETKK